MGVISRIDNMKNDLSKAELKLFRYIQKNTEKIPTMTAEQLAQATSISAPTVVRFAKKVGFNSLTDFKIQLSAETHQPSNINTYADVTPNESLDSLKDKLSHNAQVTMHETASILNNELLMAALNLLKTKERVFVCGVGASELVGRDIEQKWRRIGKAIDFITDYNVLLPQLVSNQKNSVLWVISNTGDTPEIVNYAEFAKSLNIPVISLTRFGNNHLSKMADVALQVSRPKEMDQRSAATNSILAHFLAVDVLFYLYISRTEENAEKIYNSRQAIRDYRDRYL